MKYQKGFKYQLAKDEVIFVEWLIEYDIDTPYISIEHGEVLVRKGYAWDGPSGPTFDTKSFMRGSLFHDALYQLMRLEELPRSLRHQIDELLIELCLEDKMWPLRAKWVMFGVDYFAASAAHPDHVKKVYTAP